MSISVENLTALEELFVKKEWEILRDESLFSSTFNRFCSRMDLYNSTEQQLMIELGYNFLDLGINDFQPYFIEAIKKIDDINSYTSIIVAPLKKPSLRITKSSDSIWYHIKNYSDFSYETFGSKLYFTSDWDIISKGIDRPKVILILIDDFIGTGETVNDTLAELYEMNFLHNTHKIRVLTFLAQEEGVAAIEKNYGSIVIYGLGLKKGLSDNYTGDILSEKIKMMQEMEGKLKVDSEFSFGYGKSESLVALSKRATNNTFPIFWLEKGKKKLAPFKR